MQYNSNTSIKFLRQFFFPFKFIILFISFIIVKCSNKNVQQDNGQVKDSDEKTYKMIQDKDVWPSFRGEHAGAAVDQQNLPDTWDENSAKNIKWKILIPVLLSG